MTIVTNFFYARQFELYEAFRKTIRKYAETEDEKAVGYLVWKDLPELFKCAWESVALEEDRRIEAYIEDANIKQRLADEEHDRKMRKMRDETRDNLKASINALEALMVGVQNPSTYADAIEDAKIKLGAMQLAFECIDEDVMKKEMQKRMDEFMAKYKPKPKTFITAC